MPKIRALVPLTHPTTGEHFAPDTVVDVADDVAASWRADGKISLIADEEAAAKQPGNYTARTGRSDIEPLDPSAEQGGPQEDEPPPKKGKK